MAIVSIIVPTHNRAKFLKLAVESVLAQTFSDWELIVVDDGSSDNTRQIVESVQDHRLRYLYQESSERSAARNFGVRIAQGKFLVFLDDDDLLRADMIQRALKEFENPEVAVVYSALKLIDEQGQEFPQVPICNKAEGNVFRQLLVESFMVHAPLASRECVVDAGSFDEKLTACEDWDLWIRVAAEKREFKVIGEPLVSYRLHDSNTILDLDRMEASATFVLQRALQKWSTETFEFREEALGRLYLRHSIKRAGAGQIERAARFFASGIHIYPSLLEDTNTYYQVLCASQPDGYKGTSEHLDLEYGERFAGASLDETFASPDLDLGMNKSQAWSKTYETLGKLYYSAGRMRTSRRFMLKAIRTNQALIKEPKTLFQVGKTFIPPVAIQSFRNSKMGKQKGSKTNKLNPI